MIAEQRCFKKSINGLCIDLLFFNERVCLQDFCRQRLGVIFFYRENYELNICHLLKTKKKHSPHHAFKAERAKYLIIIMLS